MLKFESFPEDKYEKEIKELEELKTVIVRCVEQFMEMQSKYYHLTDVDHFNVWNIIFIIGFSHTFKSK